MSADLSDGMLGDMERWIHMNEWVSGEKERKRVVELLKAEAEANNAKNKTGANKRVGGLTQTK